MPLPLVSERPIALMKRGVCTFVEKAKGLSDASAGGATLSSLALAAIESLKLSHGHSRPHRHVCYLPHSLISDYGIVVNTDDSLLDMPAGKEDIKGLRPVFIMKKSNDTMIIAC